MEYTQVGVDKLPELPPGWRVSVDTEGSGLYKDGEPFKSGNNPPQPEARISVVSVSFRMPIRSAHSGWVEGDLVDFAWPFDQGPILGKPGRPEVDPETGKAEFVPIDQAEQDRILAAMSKVLGREVTMEDAAPNLPVSEYVKLIIWLDRRDNLNMHNSIHDMPMFAVGLREGAGGDPSVPEGFAAWDPDSEPGTWQLGVEQRLNMMEPTLRPLLSPKGRRRSIRCTMVTQKQLVDPLEPAALKKTAKRLWGEDEGTEAEELADELKKLGVRMTKRYDLLPWCGAMGRYAAKDTNLTHRLSEYQDACAEEGTLLPKFWDLYKSEMELRTTLYRMERRGVYYDVAPSLTEGTKLRLKNREIAKNIPFDPSKVMQAKRFYFGPVCSQAGVAEVPNDDPWADPLTYPTMCSISCPECGGKNGMGLEPTNRTEKTGQPQLDLTEQRKLLAEGRPWAKEFMQWTKNRNSDSKWYTGWAARTGKDGRLRTRYKQTKGDFDRPTEAGGGTISGRLAVGRWQAQAIPHGKLIPDGAVPIRKFVGNEPGYDLYEHDLATGEMRVVTVIANSVKLWDALDEGADLHAMNAKALFGVDETHPQFYDLRNAAKRGTFGILYGGGVMALMTQIEAASGIPISMQATKDAIASFFETYPEFKWLTDQATQKVERWKGGCGFLTMLDGWRRWYGLSEKTNSAVNQVIQGNLARAMIQWMLAVEREVPDVLLLQIHDSLVTRHTADEAGRKEAEKVSAIGEREFQKYFNVRGRVMTWGIEPDKWADKS